MKRSKLRRASALAFALTALTTSCSMLRVASDVNIHKVAVDLTFGAATNNTEERVAPPEFPDPGTFELPELPDIKPPPPPPPPEVEICAPFPTVDSPERVALARIEPEKHDHKPKEGEYFWGFVGEFGDQKEKKRVDYRRMSDPRLEDGNRGSVSFYVDDPFSGIKLQLLVIPELEHDPPTAYGLFLKSIEIPTKEYKAAELFREEGGKQVSYGYQDPAGYRKAFIPVDPIKLSGFPFVAGEVTTDSSPDIAAKDSIANPTDPDGEPVFRPSGNTIISKVTMGNPENVEVCADLIYTRSIAWDLRITGEYEVRLLGNFWLATAYGGFPAKDDFLVTGDLINGTFRSNMMRIDPGKVL